MALFKTSKKNTEKKAKAVAVKKEVKISHKELSGVILKPRITEKAAYKAETNNAYPFEIHKDATKEDVAKAIAKIYNVVPLKVNIVKLPAKAVRSRKGQKGMKSAIKKAYVYLRAGDKIEFV